MPSSRWKDALWNLLDALSLRRVTANVALSAGLIGLATQSAADAGSQPRVPVTPALAPEATVRKFKGKYVLKRSSTSFFIHLAGHRSHSSHSSHSSHRSHSSSSHYSGSHFSSSPTPSASAPRAPVVQEPTPPPQKKIVEQPPPKRELEWGRGVLATPRSTLDQTAGATHISETFSISPRARQDGNSFTGYVSTSAIDLRTTSIAVQVRRHAANATTIFAAAIDSENWLGFRIEGGQLSIESHTAGKTAARRIAYDPLQHRYFRLRTSKVADVVVWETSANGVSWNPEYVETATIAIDALRIAVSAGTTKSVTAPGTAVFDDVRVEPKP